jgi:hypothetical protein
LDPVLSDTTLGSSTASERLALKVRLVEIWAMTDPMSCREQLEAHAQLHFDFMNLAGLDSEPLGHVPTELRPLCAADEWLDAIAAAAPGLVIAYSVGMLRTAPPAEDQSGAATIKVFGYSLIRWFHRRNIDTPDPVWEAARERLRKSAAADDFETVAVIAALELPGDAAKLHALRELAVTEISSAMDRSRVVRHAGALSRLVGILKRDAPDLAEALTSRSTHIKA